MAKLEIKIFHRVVQLELRDPLYDDQKVSPISQLRHLESVGVYNTRITDDGLRRIARALPDCEITRR